MAAMYDAGVKHDSVATVGAWAMWGADMRRMFADVARLADAPAGTSVLDIPCGGGFAFRGLRPGQAVHYVAADISPYMLGQARRQAGRRGVHDMIEFVEADVTALQFADDSFDLCVTYNGLHCLPDSRAALAELTRVLKPGGTLRGTSCVRGCGPRKTEMGDRDAHFKAAEIIPALKSAPCIRSAFVARQRFRRGGLRGRRRSRWSGPAAPGPGRSSCRAAART